MSLKGFIICSIYAAASYAAFVAFLILKTYTSAIWSLITGLVFTSSAFLTFLSYKNRLTDWYEQRQLQYMFNFGFAIFTIGLSGMVYHIVYVSLAAYYNSPEINIYSYIPIVWSFMTSKAGGSLMFFVRRIQSDVESAT